MIFVIYCLCYIKNVLLENTLVINFLSFILLLNYASYFRASVNFIYNISIYLH